MRNWDHLISEEAVKVATRTRTELFFLLTDCQTLSENIGNEIDKILNKVTRNETINNQTYQSVRKDAHFKEWEATFSVINMASAPIVHLVCSGYYLQAICLVRQEFEGIAQFKHIAERSRTVSKAPNISHFKKQLRELYGDLSEGAHIASHDAADLQAPQPTGFESMLALLPHGSSLIPVYSRSAASSILKIHRNLRQILWDHLIRHIKEIGI